MKPSFTLRPVTTDDEAILWQMLYYAAHMHEEAGRTVADAMQNLALVKYVTHWGRTGDLGYVAEVAGQPVGAVWVRLFAGEDKAYSPTDDVTPELAIAVLPEYIGQGIGTALMALLIDNARLRYPAVALNVRADNPALRLYRRLGFVVVGEMENRVGGRSYDMRLVF
ncbi:MAG: GNAT family N-acetyltransferase [Caldilineaceae bacterium]